MSGRSVRAACGGALGFVFLVATSIALSQPAPIGPQRDSNQVVPTSHQQPTTWHYTFDRPTADWRSRGFDDSTWKTGVGGFGTPGTPAVTVNTNWATQDIWLRKEFALPATISDLSSVQLLVFHDEDVEIYFDGILAAQADGFVTNYEPMEIRPQARKLLAPGAKFIVAVHCRQVTGGQGIDVGLSKVSSQWLSDRRKDRLRDFAMNNSGNAVTGRTIFQNEQRVGCVRCHTIDGSAGRAGPDLQTIGDKFPRAELIDAVLHPSANIAVGYSSTIVTTKNDAFVGVVKEAADDHIGLMGGDGKMQRIAAADIVSRRTQTTSLMPEGLESGFSPPEFTDLIEYLTSLRLPEMADAGRAGMPTNIPELRPAVALTPIHSPENHFEHPCWIGQLPGAPDTFLICEHEAGRIWKLTTGGATGTTAESKTLWADFRNEVRPGGATGLLGLAFHPHFRENRKYYIQHQEVIDGRIVARITEKLASEDFTRDSGTPSRTIFEIPCSTDVHSGGGIEFGPDGLLYIGMGDTGPMGDPEGHAQSLRVLQGKMLRIDVDHEEPGKRYAIPQDNPFRNREGARPEIWAYGFREPWRFSFDKVTNDFWVGDVGQDRIEEVDIIHAGENLGWNVYEGFDRFSNRYRTEGEKWTPPIFAYNRRLGNSITGGYVYRGQSASPFYGVYICADYTSKRVWGLKQADRKLTGIWQLCTAPQRVASFGQDEAGELYLVGYEGTIYKLNFNAAATPAATADLK